MSGTIGEALLEKMLEDAEDALKRACDEINDLKRRLKECEAAMAASPMLTELMKRMPAALRLRTDEMADLEVQCKFWRQAAEHAVNGWNALEDKVEAAREILDALEGNALEARMLLGSSDEFAPPELKPEPTIELAPGRHLRVVETETPFEEP